MEFLASTCNLIAFQCCDIIENLFNEWENKEEYSFMFNGIIDCLKNGYQHILKTAFYDCYYEAEDLVAITINQVFYMLFRGLTDNMPKNAYYSYISEKLDSHQDDHTELVDLYKKRESLALENWKDIENDKNKEKKKKRLQDTCKYFNVPEKAFETPCFNLADTEYNNFLFENKSLKNFIEKEEAFVTKEFLCKISEIYDKLSKYEDSYTKFNIYFKLEFSIQFELVYKFLKSIKNLKYSKYISADEANKLVEDVASLMNIPALLKPEYNGKERNMVYFGVDKLVEVFEKERSLKNVKNYLFLLNFCVQIVSMRIFGIFCKIVEEKKIDYFMFRKFLECDAATSYFDRIFKKYESQRGKISSQQIIFQHFKKIYKIKPHK